MIFYTINSCSNRKLSGKKIFGSNRISCLEWTHILYSSQSSSKKNRIEIKGFVTDGELKYHYLHCKAMVYPSLYEGFGIPVLEALNMNCPVLTSKGTVMAEIAGDAAIYFDPFSHESIASSINDLLGDYERKLQKINGNYAAFKEKFNWGQSACQLKQLFESI